MFLLLFHDNNIQFRCNISTKINVIFLATAVVRPCLYSKYQASMIEDSSTEWVTLNY